MSQKHLSGFVNIIGKPNVGKSTLMNALVGERMSIITNKPQTTRHRIIGIVNDENSQIIFSDTPGFISDPSYEMQENMNAFVNSTFDDADVMLFVVDVTQLQEKDNPLIEKLQKVKVPLFLVLNKVDLIPEDVLLSEIAFWKTKAAFTEILPISALKKEGTEKLFNTVLSCMKEGPAYYPKDQFTDRPERFFISEIIREKILLLYHQEIPYSCEVIVDSFKEDPNRKLVRMHATIYVSRKSQKGIIIGKNGFAIKQLGIDSRKDIETFLESQVFLQLFVKVRDNWRNDERMLKSFGYKK